MFDSENKGKRMQNECEIDKENMLQHSLECRKIEVDKEKLEIEILSTFHGHPTFNVHFISRLFVDSNNICRNLRHKITL